MQFKCEYPGLCLSAFPDSMYRAHLQDGITPGVFLAKQILPLILVPYSLLRKVQAACMKYSMKMKYCSLRVGNNKAVTFIWGKTESITTPHSLGDVLLPLGFYLLFCFPAVHVTAFPALTFASAGDRSSAKDGQAWGFYRGVYKWIASPGVCVHLKIKTPIQWTFQGSLHCSSSVLQYCLFYLAFLSCWEGMCSTTLEHSTTST